MRILRKTTAFILTLVLFLSVASMYIFADEPAVQEDSDSIFNLQFTPTTSLTEDPKIEIVSGHKDVNGTLALRGNGSTHTITEDGKLNINTGTATNNFALYFAGWYENDHFGKEFITTYDISVDSIVEGNAIMLGIFNDNQIYSTSLTIVKDPEKENTASALVDCAKNCSNVDNVKTIGGTEIFEMPFGEMFKISFVYHLGADATSTTTDVYANGFKVYTWESLKYMQNASSSLSNDGDNNGIWIACSYIKVFNNVKEGDVFTANVFSLGGLDFYKGAEVKESSIYHMEFAPTTDLESDPKVEIISGHKDINGTLALRGNGSTHTITQDGMLNINTGTATNNFALYFAGWYESDRFGKEFAVSYDLSVDKIEEGNAIMFGIFNDNQIYSTSLTIVKDAEKENTASALVNCAKNCSNVDNVKTIGGTEIAEMPYGELFKITFVYHIGADAKTTTTDVYVDGIKVYTWESLKYMQNASSSLSNDGDNNGIWISCAYIKVYNNVKENDVFVGSVFNIKSLDIYKATDSKEADNALFRAYADVAGYVDVSKLSAATAASVNAVIKSVKTAAMTQTGVASEIAAQAKQDIDTAAIVEYKTVSATELENYFDASSYSDAIKTIVNQYVTEGKTAINAATTIAAVDEASAAAKAQIDNDLLGTFKTALKTALDEYKSATTGFAETAIAGINTAIDAGKTAIDAAATIEEAVTANANAVTTVEALILQAKIEAAGNEIETYVDFSGYAATVQATFQKQIAKAKDELGELTSADGIAAIVEKAKAALDKLVADNQPTTTEMPTAEETAEPVGTTESDTNGGEATTTTAGTEQSAGCKSIVSGVWIALPILAGVIIFRKKKED